MKIARTTLIWIVALFFALIATVLVVNKVGGTHELKQNFTVSGIASHYRCTAGWCDGTPTAALPLALGGRYDGTVHGYVEVCGDRCVVIPVVDYCQCYWGTSNQRVIDLNEAAWRLVTNAPLSKGLITVTVRSLPDGLPEPLLPDTALPTPPSY